MDRWGPKHVELKLKCWLKLIHWDHIVYLVGLYIYILQIIHGTYNVTPPNVLSIRPLTVSIPSFLRLKCLTHIYPIEPGCTLWCVVCERLPYGRVCTDSYKARRRTTRSKAPLKLRSPCAILRGQNKIEPPPWSCRAEENRVFAASPHYRRFHVPAFEWSQMVRTGWQWWQLHRLQ